MTLPMIGGLMLVYSALYTAHFIFDTLNDTHPLWAVFGGIHGGSSIYQDWAVFNVIATVGILTALAFNFAHTRAQSDQVTVTLFYANPAL